MCTQLLVAAEPGYLMLIQSVTLGNSLAFGPMSCRCSGRWRSGLQRQVVQTDCGSILQRAGYVEDVGVEAAQVRED